MTDSKRKGGYVLIDLGGMEIMDHDEPIVTTEKLYNAVRAAIENNKPIYVTNYQQDGLYRTPRNISGYRVDTPILAYVLETHEFSATFAFYEGLYKIIFEY